MMTSGGETRVRNVRRGRVFVVGKNVHICDFLSEKFGFDGIFVRYLELNALREGDIVVGNLPIFVVERFMRLGTRYIYLSHPRMAENSTFEDFAETITLREVHLEYISKELLPEDGYFDHTHPHQIGDKASTSTGVPRVDHGTRRGTGKKDGGRAGRNGAALTVSAGHSESAHVQVLLAAMDLWGSISSRQGAALLSEDVATTRRRLQDLVRSGSGRSSGRARGTRYLRAENSCSQDRPKQQRLLNAMDAAPGGDISSKEGAQLTELSVAETQTLLQELIRYGLVRAGFRGGEDRYSRAANKGIEDHLKQRLLLATIDLLDSITAKQGGEFIKEGRPQAARLLRDLRDSGVVKKIGERRGTRYTRA